MVRLKQLSLFAAITCWAFIIGGFAYSHVVYFPSYLTHLPESNNLITAPYGIHDDAFWKLIHPITILLTLVALLLNRRRYSTRKYILVALSIYVLAIIATFLYFVPNLVDFANSNNNTSYNLCSIESPALLQ